MNYNQIIHSEVSDVILYKTCVLVYYMPPRCRRTFNTVCLLSSRYGWTVSTPPCAEVFFGDALTRALVASFFLVVWTTLHHWLPSKMFMEVTFWWGNQRASPLWKLKRVVYTLHWGDPIHNCTACWAIFVWHIAWHSLRSSAQCFPNYLETRKSLVAFVRALSWLSQALIWPCYFQIMQGTLFQSRSKRLNYAQYSWYVALHFHI